MKKIKNTSYLGALLACLWGQGNVEGQGTGPNVDGGMMRSFSNALLPSAIPYTYNNSEDTNQLVSKLWDATQWSQIWAVAKKLALGAPYNNSKDETTIEKPNGGAILISFGDTTSPSTNLKSGDTKSSLTNSKSDPTTSYAYVILSPGTPNPTAPKDDPVPLWVLTGERGGSLAPGWVPYNDCLVLEIIPVTGEGKQFKFSSGARDLKKCGLTPSGLQSDEPVQCCVTLDSPLLKQVGNISSIPAGNAVAQRYVKPDNKPVSEMEIEVNLSGGAIYTADVDLTNQEDHSIGDNSASQQADSDHSSQQSASDIQADQGGQDHAVNNDGGRGLEDSSFKEVSRVKKSSSEERNKFGFARKAESMNQKEKG